MTGIHSHLITGDFRLGTEDDLDIYSITDYGVVIGEAKAVMNLQENQIPKIIGQLMGEIAVMGHRHGQIPILVIASDSYKFDDLAEKHKVVICSWWELQYPKRILHRLKTGKRTEEEIAEKAAVEAKKVVDDKARIEAEKKAAAEAKQRMLKDKKLKEQEKIATMEKYTIFSGEILLEDIQKNERTKDSFFILNVDKLRGKVITVSHRKWKILFDEKKNRDSWTGYDIEIVTKSGAEFTNIDVEDDVVAYLLHCKVIKNEE